MDEKVRNMLNDNYKGWEWLENTLTAKAAFMTMYLDNVPDDESSAYYEGWLDAIDTFKTWTKKVREDLNNG